MRKPSIHHRSLSSIAGVSRKTSLMAGSAAASAVKMIKGTDIVSRSRVSVQNKSAKKLQPQKATVVNVKQAQQLYDGYHHNLDATTAKQWLKHL